MQPSEERRSPLRFAGAAYLAFLLVMLYFTFTRDRGVGDLTSGSRVRADLPSFVGAIESYYVDSNVYPWIPGDATVPAAPDPGKAAPLPTPQQLPEFESYDPTNGTTAIGDVYRTRQ